MSLKKLPLGSTNFALLRANGYLYVDKTEQIFELVKDQGAYFFTRPRRFGKSLLLSTIGDLFKNGTQNFQDLAIQKLWKDKTYPVVKLDFSHLTPFVGEEDFERKVYQYLTMQFKTSGLLTPDSPGIANSFDLKGFLQEFRNHQIVLLIDEYDSPLIECLGSSEEFDKVARVLMSFYAPLESHKSKFRFLLITGITRFHNSLFPSYLNQFTDITFDPRFGILVGFTLGEVSRAFRPYLENSAAILGSSLEELMLKLAQNYGGFCFEESALKRVLSPWALLMFLKYPQNGFKNYWFQSASSPLELRHCFNTRILTDPLKFSERKVLSFHELNSSLDFDSVNEEELLTQLGYLTIKRKDGSAFVIDYPNREVKRSMADMYTQMLLKGKTLVGVGAGEIEQSLAAGDAPKVLDCFNKIFASLDYHHFPIQREVDFQGYLYTFLNGAGLKPLLEVHNAYGRSDLEVSSANIRWIFELKIARTRKEANEKLKEAVLQIKERKYGEQNSERLLRMALVFSIEKREIVLSELVS